MRLSDYLAEEKVSDSAFANSIGVTRQALWRYKSGERRPEWGILENIFKITKGKVTPNDFLGERKSIVQAYEKGGDA